MRFWEQRRPPPRFRSTARFWEQQIALSLKHAFSGLARLATKRVFSRISQKGAFLRTASFWEQHASSGKPVPIYGAMPDTAPFTVPPTIDTELADASGWHAYSRRYPTVLSVASSCLQLIPAYSAIAVVCS